MLLEGISCNILLTQKGDEMTDLEKIAKECGVSFRKLRLIVKTLRRYGLMPPQEKVEEVERMRAYLAQGQSLSVYQLMDLIEHPGIVKVLGKYGRAAKAALDNLDNPKANPAPRAASVACIAASKGSADMLEMLIAWAKETIPARGCTYHYLVLRLAYGCLPEEQDNLIRKASRSFMLARQRPSFEGWWRVEQRNKRPVTIFHPPT